MLRWYLVIVVAAVMTASLLSRLTPGGSQPAARPVISMNESAEPSDAEESGDRPSLNRVDGSIELRRHDDGHFYADVRINGADIHMLVDTGATQIALSRDDARMAGIATSIGMNDVIGKGADGVVHGEYVKIDRIELGPLSVTGLDAVVLNSGEQSLLGQGFLRKFSSVQIEGDKMVLR